MVSWIQSNYTTFGAGVAVPGTGISFQNRGANFSLDPNSDNCLAGELRKSSSVKYPPVSRLKETIFSISAPR